MPYVGNPGSVVECASVGMTDTVITDRGTHLKNRDVDSLCDRLGISRIFGEPHRPTGRSQVEVAFRIMKDSFLGGLPGFAGGGVHEAGRAPAKDALLFDREVELIFARCLVDIYDQMPQSGLHLPGQPKRDLSPAEMRAEGIARCGYYAVPVSPTLYYEALPVYFRQISDRGVRIDGLTYDGEVLNPYRGRSSGLNPKLYARARQNQAPHRIRADKRQPWPFRRDPRDIARIYFQDPASLDWHPLDCIDLEHGYMPFSDVLWRYARAAVARGSAPKLADRRRLQIDRLNALLREFGVETPRAQAERRIFQKNWLKHVQAALDRARSKTTKPNALETPAYKRRSVLDEFDISQLDQDENTPPHEAPVPSDLEQDGDGR